MSMNLCAQASGNSAILTAEDTRLATESPCCMGTAVHGTADACTCWMPVFDLEAVDPVEAPYEIQVRMCVDCAFRPDSPERTAGQGDDLEAMAREGSNIFWCHQGMRRVVAWRHPDGRERPADAGDYRPAAIGNVPYRADGTPGLVCAGWAALRLHAAFREGASA